MTAGRNGRGAERRLPSGGAIRTPDLPSAPPPMLRALASGLLTRNVARRVARFIPNPFVRTLAIAAVGFGVNRLVMGAGRRSVAAPRRYRLG